MINLKSLVTNFFIENGFDKFSNHLCIVRSDGIVLYSNSKDKFVEGSIGALASGVWQAASSMMSYVNKNDDSDFRFNFDTSSNGIYILPINLCDTRCYLVAMYQEEFNPAKLKQYLKNLLFLLEMYIRDESISVSNESSNFRVTHNRREYLFEDITDEEIDKLFNFSEVR